MPKINPPCIRNIYKFRETGCPQCKWDKTEQEGCVAWLEQVYDNVDPAKEPIVIKACMDVISFDVSLKMLRLLEGNQIATESLRNGLCTTVDGKVEPKPDKMVEHFLCLLTESHNKRLLS